MGGADDGHGRVRGGWGAGRITQGERLVRRKERRSAKRERMMSQIEWVPTWALAAVLVLLVGGWILFLALA